MGKLEGKIALVTGGSSGIGLATAKRFVKEGAHVFITGRREEELSGAVKDVARNVTGIRGDVSNLADLDRLVDQIKRDKGRLDVLFANAGVAKYAPLGRITEEPYDGIFDVNVKGVLFTVQKAPAAFARWSLHHPERFDCGQQRPGVEQRVQRDQGCGPLIRPHLDHGSQGAAHPRERSSLRDRPPRRGSTTSSPPPRSARSAGR